MTPPATGDTGGGDGGGDGDGSEGEKTPQRVLTSSLATCRAALATDTCSHRPMTMSVDGRSHVRVVPILGRRRKGRSKGLWLWDHMMTMTYKRASPAQIHVNSSAVD